MSEFYATHASWVLLALVVIAVVVLATIYAFWRRRYIDNGPRKGTAANPTKVRMENPPDH